MEAVEKFMMKWRQQERTPKPHGFDMEASQIATSHRKTPCRNSASALGAERVLQTRLSQTLVFLGFLLFSTIWGICSSFKVNPSGLTAVERAPSCAAASRHWTSSPRLRLAAAGFSFRDLSLLAIGLVAGH